MSIMDDYLEKLMAPQRAVLEHMRTVIKQVAPNAEEVRTYGMPGFKYHKKYLIAFAAFKNHLSIFPTPEPIEALKDQLGDFTLSKGTIQFTLEKPIPDALLKQIVKHRINTIEGGSSRY